MVTFLTFSGKNYDVNSIIKYEGFIQLLPFSNSPYVQITQSKNDLILPNVYTVYLRDCSGKINQDVSNYITITQVEEYSVKQLRVVICQLPFDYMTTPVQIVIKPQGVGGQELKSNYFLLTELDKEKTSRIDYIDTKRNITGILSAETYQSIRLGFYLNNEILSSEVETYYQISTSQNVNNRISLKEYLEWKTQPIDSWTFKQLSRALYTGRCYINYIRNYIVEAIELNPRQGNSNISENTFITDPNDTDVISYSGCNNLTPFRASSSTPSSTTNTSAQQYE